ncbi:adenosine deaminase [Pseudomonadota bacterium]
MKVSRFIGVMACVWGLSGCATILSEDVAKVNVQTTSGKQVDVTIDGAQYTAPSIVTLPKDGTSKVIVTADAACAKETYMARKIEPTFWVNVLSGGLFGSTTDSASGKMWTYDDSVMINCQ